MSLRKITKFGGSSCGNAEAYRKLAKYFRDQHEQGHSVVGVFSAMFGVTDRLLGALDYAKRNEAPGVEKERNAIWALHERTLTDLLQDKSRLQTSLDWMDERFTRYFDTTTQSVMQKGDFTAQDKDNISHLGERLSIKIMDSYCKDVGLPSMMVESDNILVTNGVSGDSTPLLDATRERAQHVLLPMWQRGQIPMVSGFFGSSVNGKLTTLGRGGTDLTAAVLGHSLDVDEINLFKVEYTKDEDGWLKSWEPGWIGVVHDADPDLTIPEMSYRDAAQLAHFGKKVLHPATVHPAVEKRIPIFVKNNYDHSHPGTRIQHQHDSLRPIISVTSTPLQAYEEKTRPLDIVVPANEDQAREQCRSVVNSELLQATLSSMTSLQHRGLIRTGIRDAKQLCSNLDELRAMLETRISKAEEEAQQDKSTEPMALVVVVGVGVANIPHFADRVFDTLKNFDVMCTIPDYVNGSPDHVTLVIKAADKKKAVRILHRTLVGKKIQRMDIIGSDSFWSYQNPTS